MKVKVLTYLKDREQILALIQQKATLQKWVGLSMG